MGEGHPPAPAGSEPASLRGLVGDTGVYALARAFGPLAALVAIPVLTRELGPARFGTIDLLITLTAVGGMVAMVGMDSAAARSWFDREMPPARRPVVVATAARFVAITSLALALVAAVVLLGLQAAGVDVGDGTAALVAFLIVPAVTAQAMLREGFRLRGSPGWYAAVSGCAAVVGASAAVALVVAADMGVVGYFLGLGAGALAALALAAVAGPEVLRAPTDRDELRVMLRFGLPLVPASVALWALMFADRTVVGAFHGVDEIGLYGLGSRVTTPLLLAVQAFQVAWIPFALQAYRDAPREEPVVRGRVALMALAAVVGGGVILVALASPLVALLGGEAFERADAAVLPLVIAWIGYAVSAIGFIPFSFARRSGAVARITGACAALGVVLALALVPPFGFAGAAWATAVSYVLLGAAALRGGQRIAPARLDVGRLAQLLAIAAVGLPAAALADGAGSAAGRAVACAGGLAALTWVLAGTRRGRGLR